MSRTKGVKVDGLANEIIKTLNTYTKDIQEGITDASKTIAEEGKERLKQTKQPSGEGGTARPMKRRQWNKYSRGWKVKVKERPNYTSSIIHNATDYQLTHLLEYGHITRNGTRTRAFKHIQPVEEECKEKFVKQCEEVIKRGGK